MAPQPRGHKASKQDLSREALSIAMKNTLRIVMAEKEEANVKRDGRRRREKVEQMLSFADIQRKTHEVQYIKLELADGKERSRKLKK
jgi:hypothetical protein